MQTFLFYDIETTGLSKPFDQILQFAAIRTDLSLNEIERYQLQVKINPFLVPAPTAIITHQIPWQAMQTGLSEYEAIKQIHQWMNTPGTISLGYNTLGFDDEFLRFSFYRHLLPPYTHQYANQCGRMDLYPLTVMYYLFKNDILQWPRIDGIPSLKLEQLNLANQLAKGQSHDAMVDVEATLALARCFFKEKKMWDYLVDYFNKNTDQERMDKIPPHSYGLCIEGIFGPHQFYQSLALPLGTHRHYRNQTLWLSLDAHDMSELTTETIPDIRIIRKKPTEPPFILPLENSYQRFLKYITPEKKELAAHNHRWLKENEAIFSALKNYHLDFQYPHYPEADAYARLYMEGFPSPQDQKNAQLFHTASSPQKALLIDQFQSPTLKTLALSLVGQYYPEYLNDRQRAALEKRTEIMRAENRADAPIDHQGKKRMSPEAARLEAETLLKTRSLSPEQIHLLSVYRGNVLEETANPKAERHPTFY